MKIKHTAHRYNSKVGTIEDLPTDQALRLIRTGFAVAVDAAPAPSAPMAPPVSPAPAPAAAGDAAPKAAPVKPAKG